MKKILIISHDFPPFGGGQGKYVFEIARRLLTQFNVLTTFSDSRKNYLNNKVIEIDYKGGNPIILIWKIFHFYLKNINKDDYDIIHGNCIDHFLFLVFKEKNKKYITTTHNTYLQRWYAKKKNIVLFFIYPFFIILEYFVLKRSDKIICVSNLTKNYIEKMGIKKNIVVIENGVDTELYKPIKKDKYIYNFLYVGRLEQRKNILYTLKIFKEFIKSYNGNKIIKFYIVGTGPDYNKIKNFININKLEKYIILEGFKSNIKYYYDICNCIMLLSKGEGLPLVILEAMSCGLSGIITKDASGKTKFIENCNNISIVNDTIEKDKNIILEYMNKYINNNKVNLICKIPNWNYVIRKIKKIYEQE